MHQNDYIRIRPGPVPQQDEFVDIRSGRSRLGYGRNRSPEEESAVIEVLHAYDPEAFDGIHAVSVAKNLEFITHDMKKTMLNEIVSTENPFMYFLSKLFPVLKFYHFVMLFQRLGIYEIANQLIEVRFKPVYSRPGRVPVPFATSIQRFYRFQKSHADNKIYKTCTSEHLKKAILGFDSSINDSSLDLDIRQESLERKSAMIVLLVQQYNDLRERMNVLQTLIENIPDDLDRRSADLVFHSKFALTQARGNDRGAVENHLREATLIFDNCEPAFPTVSFIHDALYIERTFYIQDPTETNLKRVLDIGHVAIQSLAEDDDEVQRMWKRLFLSFMILCLLRISSVFSMVDIELIPRVNIEFAKQAIKEMDKVSRGIETRRKMILELCKGRAVERDDIDEAIAHVKQALTLAADGTFFDIEIQNIQRYADFLEAKRSG